MALTINDFHAVSNGKHNAGFVDIDPNGQLAIHNNHVHLTSKNRDMADAEKNMAVRNAFLNALSSEMRLSEQCRTLLVDRLVSDPKVVYTPLTRREIKELLEIARNDAAYGGIRASGGEAAAPETLQTLGTVIGQDITVRSFSGKLTSTFEMNSIPKQFRLQLLSHADTADTELQKAYRLSAQDFTQNPGASEKQVTDAIMAIANFESDLRLLYRSIPVGPASEALMEMIDACAAREAELSASAGQLKALQGAPEKKLGELMGVNAARMHGNDDVMKVLSAEVTDLRTQIDALHAAAPDQEVTEETLRTLETNIMALQTHVANLSVNGLMYGGNVKKDKVVLEKSFLQGLEKAVVRMLEDLRKIRRPNIVREMRRLIASMPDSLARQRTDLLNSIQDDGTINKQLYTHAIAELQDIAMSGDLYDNAAKSFAFYGPKLLAKLLEEIHQMQRYGHLALKPGVLEKLLRGELSAGSLVATYAYGLTEDLVDDTLDDRRLIASPKKLGSGINNTAWQLVYRNPDGSTKTRVFKDETTARIGLDNLLLGKSGYNLSNRMIEINIACGKAASMLGVPGVMVQSTAGVHGGKIGVFMEKAEGEDGADASDSGKKARRDLGLRKRQLAAMPPADRARKVGSLMKSSCDLEWVDWLTGQGDRHMHNLLVANLPDGRMKMTGIDNDASFSAARVGRTKFVLTNAQVNAICRKLGVTAPFEVNLNHPDALVENERGKWVLNLCFKDTQDLDPEIADIVKDGVIGLNNCALPRRISQEVYDRLMAIADKPDAFEAFVVETLVGRHFDNSQADALRSRLHEMIDYAKHLKSLQDAGKGHYILTPAEWESEETVRTIAAERTAREASLRDHPKTLRLEQGYYDRLAINI